MISRNYQLNFQQFTELLTENHIPYCLVAGTLLGAIREYNFIKHDEDIDIGIPVEYKEQTIQVIKKSDWKFYCVWRRELGITRHGFAKNESKIDLFFLETDELYTYLYSYKKNPFNGTWDIEWRMKFPKELFSKFKKWRIGDIQTYIPERAAEIMELEYGLNYKISNPKWNTYDAPAYDESYREIAIVITTFLRNDKLKKLINSIQITYHKDWYKLYIADQGYYSLEKDKYYEQLREKGHYITYLPFNSGLSFCRNHLVNKVTEPFILLLDDDFIMNTHTNLSNYINILNTDRKLGVVGGKLEGHQEYNYDLFYDAINHKIYYIRLNNKVIIETLNSYIQPPVYFNYCDIVLNFAMFKNEVFKSIQWDNILKLAEHSDFYLRLKKDTDWKVAYTDSVIANHQNELNSSDYISLRRNINNEIGMKIFYDKYKITGDHDLIILKDERKEK